MRHKSSEEVQTFIYKIFENIENIKTLKDLEDIEIGINEKYRMNIGTYPKITFEISKSEVDELIENGIITHSQKGYFLNERTIHKLPPIARLLYSVLWKNGDLKKINHIIQGIDECSEETEKVDGLVFYQFGKYLSNKSEPIIDQHVIRAFAVYRPINNGDVDKLRKMKTIDKRHLNYIKNYKDWLSKLPDHIKSIPDYSYYIDKLLFAVGKAIKL